MLLLVVILNLMYRSLRVTAAMEAGITDHIFTL